MILAQDFTPPPRALPLKVLLGSIAAAAVALLTQPDGTWQAKLALLPVPDSPLAWRALSSLMELIVALLLAACLGVVGAMLARLGGKKVERAAAFMGRLVACFPIAVIAWSFVGFWTGRHGLPIETLMPAQMPMADTSWLSASARVVWAHLTPALLMALPLTGEVLNAAVKDAAQTLDLKFALRSRGIDAGAQLWTHHLAQVLSFARGRLQALCLAAPAYLVVVEDVLRCQGWGGGLVSAIRAGDAPEIALSFLEGGMLMALLCAIVGLLPGRRQPVARNRFSTLAWLPWPVWMLGLMVLPPFAQAPSLTLWMGTLLLGSAAWHDVWTRLERTLPLEAAQVLGAAPAAAWRTHAAPVQGRMLVAWLSTVLGQVMLWVAAASALLPGFASDLPGPLGRALSHLTISTPQDTARVLANPTPLLLAGGALALAALCFVQVGRIIQPRPAS